jgi:hypothetical protein
MCHSEMAHMYWRHICVIPRWHICTGDTYVPFRDGTYLLAAHMCHSEIAHMYWRHILYVPFRDGTYVLAAHMCHSEMAHMYWRQICAIPRWNICTGSTYVPFRDGTYVPRHIYAVPTRHICAAKKKSLFFIFKKIKKVEFVLDHYEAFLKVSQKSVEKVALVTTGLIVIWLVIWVVIKVGIWALSSGLSSRLAPGLSSGFVIWFFIQVSVLAVIWCSHLI